MKSSAKIFSRISIYVLPSGMFSSNAHECLPKYPLVPQDSVPKYKTIENKY